MELEAESIPVRECLVTDIHPVRKLTAPEGNFKGLSMELENVELLRE